MISMLVATSNNGYLSPFLSATHAFSWVAQLLSDLDCKGRRGVVMEVRLSSKPERRVVVNVIEQLTADEFEVKRRTINFRQFHGNVEYHYAGGNGQTVVKLVTSLTEEDYKRQLPPS